MIAEVVGVFLTRWDCYERFSSIPLTGFIPLDMGNISKKGFARGFLCGVCRHLLVNYSAKSSLHVRVEHVLLTEEVTGVYMVGLLVKRVAQGG